MKIAFFVTEFPALSETFIINQIIGLQSKGHLIHVFSEVRPFSKIMHQAVTDTGLLNCTYYLDEVPNARIPKMIKLSQNFFLNIFNKNIRVFFKAVLKNNSKLSVYDLIPFLGTPQYDIVHAHFGINGNYVTQLRKLGLFKNAKFITTFHGYDLNELYAKNNFYTDLFQDCDLFTTNSEYSKKLLTKLGCKDNKIMLLPVGADVAKFNNYRVEQGRNKSNCEINILFVGRLVEFKAPDLVIKIGKIIKEKDSLSFKIRIVGHGDMRPVLENMIKEYDLEKNIILSGPRTQEEIIPIFLESDIFLFPGITWQKRAENQGLVIQEAQAMQLPVIISDAGGMKEGIIDEVTGFVVPENDIDGFVEKIELLANDPDLRKRMGEAGRNFVVENYDINKLNEKLMQIYLN